MDPLCCLPAELVLHILDHLEPSGLASLLCTSKAWQQFIDMGHQDAIYASQTDHPPLDNHTRDFSFLARTTCSFARYFDDVTDWKDLCKRQTLLHRNWASDSPMTTASLVNTGVFSAVWRFRPDFDRRFILSTSQMGGFRVTDMDTGQKLWGLPFDNVRPYAHLEYSDGWACWDRFGDALEIWRHNESERGRFDLVTIIRHDVTTRGFMLAFPTLCVVSTEGKGFVYDLSDCVTPRLARTLTIERDAVGHLTQNENTVMYSIGCKGFSFYYKATGQRRGMLQPYVVARKKYHITYADTNALEDGFRGATKPFSTPFPPMIPRQDRTVPLSIRTGCLADHCGNLVSLLMEDDWGAGLLEGDIMVGWSDAGFLCVCTDWPGAIESQERAAAVTYLIETKPLDQDFHLGGWLSVKHGRIAFEVSNRIYIITLPKQPYDPAALDLSELKAFAFHPSKSDEDAAPVSFMELFDDCFMFTYASRTPTGRTSKCVGVLSFAPGI